MRIFRRKHASQTHIDTHVSEVLDDARPGTQPATSGAGRDSSEPVQDSLLAALSIETHGGIARPSIHRDGNPQSDPEPITPPRRRRIWELEQNDSPDVSLLPPESESIGKDVPSVEPDDVALARARIAQFSQAGISPEAPRPAGGRAKTRVLGFHTADLAQKDPFAGTPGPGTGGVPSFPVGWIVVVEGPGRGACFTLINGVSSIGRGEDQSICLDFGDGSISRSNHAAIAFDDEANRFFLGQGGKSNIVRLNGRPVLSTEDLVHGDRIRIGETSLQFVAFCGEAFSWAEAKSCGEGGDAALP